MEQHKGDEEGGPPDHEWGRRSEEHNAGHLTPAPEPRAPRSRGLFEIANECGVDSNCVEHCARTPRKVVHVVPPFNCGMPDQSAVNARRVSLTAFRPFRVTEK